MTILHCYVDSLIWYFSYSEDIQISIVMPMCKTLHSHYFIQSEQQPCEEGINSIPVFTNEETET